MTAARAAGLPAEPRALYERVSRTRTHVELQPFLSRGIPECVTIHSAVIKSLSAPYNKSKIAGKNDYVSA